MSSKMLNTIYPFLVDLWWTSAYWRPLGRYPVLLLLNPGFLWLIWSQSLFFFAQTLRKQRNYCSRDTRWATQHHTDVRDYCHHCCAGLGHCFRYHSVLGLQFNLQSIHGASQLNDLLLVALLLLSAGHHLLVQLLHLKHSQRPSKDIMKENLTVFQGPLEVGLTFSFWIFDPPYLCVEPLFYIFAVCLHDRLVLTSHFL